MNSSQPLVSVITIFLNAEKFIREAIESVFAQTYDRWELILIDDGSTDASTVIALEYARQYPDKVRYLEHEGHENRGMSAARNLGIKNAAGEYISFLDSDDVWLPHKLEQQVAILASQPEAAMLYGRTRLWCSWTGNPEDLQRDGMTQPAVTLDTLIRPPTLLTLFLQDEDTYYPCTCSVIVRREIIDRVGGFEESFRNAYEDMVFHAKVFLEAPVYVSSECWDYYRRHPDSYWETTTKAGQWYPEHPNSVRLLFLEWLLTYLQEQNIKEPEVWRILQHVLWPYKHPLLYQIFWIIRKGVRLMKKLLKAVARTILPRGIRNQLRALQQSRAAPAVGQVRFGDLRRVTPISRYFGFDRGQPIDRYYVENFLARHSNDVRGHVLEIADNAYTKQFGNGRVTKSDVLHVVEGNPHATIVDDLTHARNIPSNTFDCIILTQTLHLIYDVRAAIRTLHRILKPGGVLLATVPYISQIDEEEWGSSWYWGFTALSMRRLSEEVFPPNGIAVDAHGNVLAACGLLYGLSAKELRQEELDYRDPYYQVLITLRAVKLDTEP